MAQSAANLVEHVLPVVPLRQFVVTFPFELRARLAYDRKLLAAITRIAIDSVLGFYRRRMRTAATLHPIALGDAEEWSKDHIVRGMSCSNALSKSTSSNAPTAATSSDC